MACFFLRKEAGRTMSIQIYIDGKFYAKEDAKVSVFDHGFLYGDGVFEGIRAYNGKVFKLPEHIERLYESAHYIMLNIPISPAEMQEATLEVLRRNNLRDAYIRIVVSRGPGDLGLDPKNCVKTGTVIIIGDRITLFPQECYDNGLEVITTATRQRPAGVIEPRVKSLNYLNNILVKLEAAQAGVMEGIMLSSEGYVVEGSGDNIFIVDKKGRLITPPVTIGALEGITRNVTIDLAEEAGLQVRELLFTRHDLYNARECFLTGTAAELIPVISVDRRSISDRKPGPVTKMLMEKFSIYAQNNGTPL